MLFQRSFWIFSLLLCCSLSFVVNQHNYFYLNTSYSRQTISFSLNIRASQPTQIKLISPVLIPQGNHVMIGSVEKEKSITFDNTYDSQLILYNSYQDGEHWFGVKIRYQNPQKYDFVRLQLHLKQQANITAYVFLAPLFTLPLNAIEVAPKNTLHACHQSTLLSYLYSYSEVDFYAFGRKEAAKGFKVVEKKDWGFYRQDFTSNYLRHKSKAKAGDQVTFSYTKADGKNYECKISQQWTSNQKKFANEAEGATLQELIQTSVELQPETNKVQAQL